MRRYVCAFPRPAVALAASIVGSGWCGIAAAQPALVPPGNDLRAVYANAADVTEGKGVAESTCVACHGAGGVTATKGVPRLAEQRAATQPMPKRLHRMHWHAELRA